MLLLTTFELKLTDHVMITDLFYNTLDIKNLVQSMHSKQKHVGGRFPLRRLLKILEWAAVMK